MHNWTGRHLLTPLPDATGQLHRGTPRVGSSPAGKSSCTLGPTTPPPTHLLATKISSTTQTSPTKQKPYFKCLLILQSVLLSMLLEHKLRAETLLLDQRSGNDRPAVEPAQLATCFCTAQRARKSFYIFKRLGKSQRNNIWWHKIISMKFKCSCREVKFDWHPCRSTSHSLYV